MQCLFYIAGKDRQIYHLAHARPYNALRSPSYCVDLVIVIFCYREFESLTDLSDSWSLGEGLLEWPLGVEFKVS